MIKKIVKDEFCLCQKASVASIDDVTIAQDLMDTMKAYQHECDGMAANMIGCQKRIIVMKEGTKLVLMINPVILKTSGKRYTTKEECLCLNGFRETKRFEHIKVQYQDIHFKINIHSFSGLSAQIIQHEIDHCNGIII